jgi:hypothetical protein
MKKLLTTFSAALLALFSSSCLDHEAVIKINKDGSGTITEQTLFSAEASAMMEQMAGLGGEGQDPLSKMIDAEKDGRKGGRVTYKFKDINKVKFVMGGSMSDAGKSMQPPGLPEEKKPEKKPITFKLEDGKLTLTNPQNKPAEGDGEKPEKPEIDEQQLAMAQGMFKDMRMSLKVEFPGGIEETDASNVSGNTITLAEMEFAKLVSDPAKLKKLMELDDPTAAATAFKGVDGLKVEPKETISVTLK